MAKRQGKKKKTGLCICYHGTNKKNAGGILKEGFRKGTWFALHLESALGYGGRNVFEVCFETRKIPKGNWQFIIPERYLPDRIIRYTIYSSKKMMDRPKEREKVFLSNLK